MYKKELVVGLTYGTFDLLHYGHIRLLERMAEECDLVFVYLSTDDFQKLKGKKKPIMSYDEREEMLFATPYVDFVFEEKSWEQKKVDVEYWQSLGYKTKLFIGDDWKGKFDYLPCEVIYLPRTKGISTTIIKERIRND